MDESEKLFSCGGNQSIGSTAMSMTSRGVIYPPSYSGVEKGVLSLVQGSHIEIDLSATVLVWLDMEGD
jgi:hypothetical protein